MKEQKWRIAILLLIAKVMIISMVVTMQQVLDALSPDELDYNRAAKLGPDALPYLEHLVKTADPLLASKATYLSSLIADERSVTVLKIAAQSDYPEVRVAAAAGASNLPEPAANEVLSLLKNDDDIGVRKVTNSSLQSIHDSQ
jgi:HEAT repeat protein